MTADALQEAQYHEVEMPRYYFNVYNDDITVDEEGVELADLQAAQAFAVKAARSIAAHTVTEGHFTGYHRIDVMDGEHRPVATIRFDEAVEIRS